jgi:hypothetical protein
MVIPFGLVDKYLIGFVSMAQHVKIIDMEGEREELLKGALTLVNDLVGEATEKAHTPCSKEDHMAKMLKSIIQELEIPWQASYDATQGPNDGEGQSASEGFRMGLDQNPANAQEIPSILEQYMNDVIRMVEGLESGKISLDGQHE